MVDFHKEEVGDFSENEDDIIAQHVINDDNDKEPMVESPSTTLSLTIHHTFATWPPMIWITRRINLSTLYPKTNFTLFQTLKTSKW